MMSGTEHQAMTATMRSHSELPKTPGILVSYVYHDKFTAERPTYHFRDYMLDSGAFSAYKSGTIINLDAYIAFCQRLLDTDPGVRELTALDVIGDGAESAKNAEEMRNAGLEVMPVFHLGDDWAILKDYCQGYDKVGLSCRFGEPVKESYRFLNHCFSLTWPHKFHSFGWVDEKMLLRYPFHSADTASWTNGPNVYGRWRAFGGKMSVYGHTHLVLAEVAFYLALEERLRAKWRQEMAKIETPGQVLNGRVIYPFQAPQVRLAYSICTVARNTLRETK